MWWPRSPVDGAWRKSVSVPAIGHSILDEIRSVRRTRAEMALSPFRTQLRDEIAALCGYASWSSVHRLLCNENKLNN